MATPDPKEMIMNGSPLSFLNGYRYYDEDANSYAYSMDYLLGFLGIAIAWLAIVAIIGIVPLFCFGLVYAGLNIWFYIVMAPQLLVESFGEKYGRIWTFYGWAFLI